MTQIYVLVLIGAILVGSSQSVQHFVDGDVDILINDTNWKCDRITCPEGTFKCVVILKPKSKTELSRINTCYNQDGVVLNEANNTQPMNPGEKKYLKVEAFEKGITTSSQSLYESNYYSSGSSNSYHISSGSGNYDHKLAEKINRQVQQQVQKQVKDQMDALQRELGQLQQNMFGNAAWRRR